MRTVKGEGQYTRKSTGEDVSYAYEFPVYESLEEAIEKLSSAKALAMLNQTSKEDCANNARENAKRANGDSTARILTPEEKEANKAKAKADRELLKALKAKGLSLADLEKLIA